MNIEFFLTVWRATVSFDPMEDVDVVLERWMTSLLVCAEMAGIPRDKLIKELHNNVTGFLEDEYQSRLPPKPGESFRVH